MIQIRVSKAWVAAWCVTAGVFVAVGIASAQAYLDNNTIYSNQDPNTETRRSDHFRINFGHYNRDTGTPVTEQLVQGNLQMYEQMWNRWVVEMGLHDINESVTEPDGNKYRANFNLLMTWDDGGGGGAWSSMDAGGFFYAMANSGYARFDPPSGATPHEFGHVWEGSCGGFNGSNSSGAWWECTANWMQLQFLNSYPQAGGYIYNGMYYPAHGRDYYDSFMIWEEAREDPRYGAAWVNEVWTNATPDQKTNEYIIDRMIRVDSSGSPDKAGAINDLWGNMAKKLVTWDYERQKWLAQANKADDGSDWEFYQRCRTPLVKLPGGGDWYRPSRDHIPMEFGFNIIPLAATPATTVSCSFQPQCDPVRQSDWRACLVAVDGAGGTSYSSLWNRGTNSITLSADQSKLYLVVIATPKPMKIADPAWRAYLTDAGLQFPYAVAFTNAAPKNVIYPVQSHSGMVQHANGGGWKATTATVDATAYLGPNAQVLNSAQVKGLARVEDYAVVRNSARVRDNAVVSGHGMVEGNAQVYGNAKVRDWGRVFGYVEIYENAKVIEHGNCGDGDASTHTRVYGNAIIKGTTYVYNTSTFNGGLIMDGDSANGNGTTPSSKGVHFGWGWGQDIARFAALPDNDFIYARHSFEKDNAVFAMDEYGINHGFLMNDCRTAVDAGTSVRGGRVLPLDGVSQYVELHHSVNDFKDCSISLWCKPAGGAADQRLWSLGDGANKAMYLTTNAAASGALRFVITDGTTTRTLDGPVLPADTWKHIAVVFSGTTCALYLDGVEVASSPAMTLFPDSLNAPLMENANYLGRGNAGNYFQGTLDDFRWYMRPLAAAEVLALFNAAAPAPVTIAADHDAPTPNAATWLVAPTSNGDDSATMSATPGTDASGWVEYYFTCVSGGGHDSGWVSFNKYTDVGLTPGSAPGYTVKMRDRAGNTTGDSAAATVAPATSTAGSASFAYGPIGIANGQITMTATKVTHASGKAEYKFDLTAPTTASSGWRASPTWTQTGLTTGSSYTYTVTVRDGRGNTSSPSAAASALARDDAGPAMPITAAHWQMLPYSTVDNKLSMTAQAASDPAGVEYYFHCVSGGGPDSAWQAGTTFVTPAALADGTYIYQYKVRDKSARHNESPYSTTYPARITPTTGYHTYTLGQVLAGADDNLVSFPGTVMKVNADNYQIKDLATGDNIIVKPSTYALETDPALALKNVTVKGHVYTFAGSRVITYATLAATGNPTLYTISGMVSNSSGGPVAGATVVFADVENAATHPVVTTTTDASGNFSRGVTTGTWYVAVASSAYNTSADQVVGVGTANVTGVNFTLVPNSNVIGAVTRCSDGTPLAGATVYFSRSPGASAVPVFTLTADANGNFSQAVQDGVWYVASGAAGFYTAADKTITVNGAAVGGINFALKGSARNIPQPADLLFSVVTDSLPASGATGNWPTYQPSGQTLTQIGSPTVETINGVKWVKNNRMGSNDGFRQGTYAAPLACNGVTIVAAVKPVYCNPGGEPRGEIVDIFYDRLALAVSHTDGRIMVCRNYWNDWGPALPDGQTTVLTLVVQTNGSYVVYANGVQVMTGGANGDWTSINPDHTATWGNDAAFTHSINVGRSDPDGWSAFNGYIGDVFVYQTALANAERQQLEADVSAKFLATEHTITTTAGAGGTINPMGAVAVCPGGSQTFTIAPLLGYAISGVTVDGVPQGAVGSYAFSNVAGNHTIDATFSAVSNTPPAISTIATQNLAANTGTGALPFTVADAGSDPDSLIVTAGSSNPALVPDANIVLGGSGANRTVTVTPALMQTGNATITLTVSDGLATATSDFVVHVTLNPGAPTISAVADQTIDEDQATSAIAITVADPDTDLSLLTLTGVSSNPSLVPDANIVFSGSGSARSVVITPLPDQNGETTLTLTVSDGTSPASTSFLLTVHAVNDAPVISNIADLTVAQDSASGVVPFTVDDAETAAASLEVTASSSNSTLVPAANVMLGGSGANRTVQVTPATGKSGSAVITLTASDGTATAADSFVLTVLPPNIAASISVNYDTIPSTTPALSPAASAGVVPSVNWNNIASNGTGGFLHPTQTFHNHQGSVVAGFTVAASSGGPDSWNTAGTPDQTLYGDWINAGAGTTLTFAGIPYATYDLYLYESHYASNEVVTFTIGGEVQSLSNTAGPFGAPTHRLNDSYVKFTGLTASSISVVVAATSGSVGIAGFQIVDASPGGGGNAFADWIAGFPALGAATGFTDDPDGDGIENGIENYLGSNPSQPGIALTGVSSSAASITFRHTRSNNVAADVTAIYQWSSDLVNWFTSGQTSGEGTVATITPTVITDTDTPANDLIEVTVTVSGGSTARVFARIQGSQLP